MNRLLNEIQHPFSENDKLKLRRLFKTGLGLSKNTSEKKLADTIGVPQRLLYNFLMIDYNEYVRNENERILNQRKIQADEKRIFNKQLKNLEIKDEVSFNNLNKNKLKLILKRLIELPMKFVIHFNDKIYTLNDITKDRLLHNLDNLYLETEMIQNGGSDIELIDYIRDINDIKIEKVNINYQFNEGAFFKYTHNLKGLDLSVLQIFDSVDTNNYKDNCFIHSLKGQVDDNILEDCKYIIRGKHTSLKSIKYIAEKHNLYINIKIDDKNYTHYGNKEHKAVNICLLENHYFKLCDINITSYAIKNYFQICHKKNWNEFIKPNERAKRFINSYNVVKLLLQHKDTHLQEITKCDEIYKTCYYDDVNEINTLEYSENNIIKNSWTEKTDKNKYYNVFFDFETIPEQEHTPYLCCVKSHNLKRSFIGYNCAKQMLDFCHKYFKGENIKYIAHNITYDLKFLFDHLCKQSYIKRGSFIMCGQASYYSYGKEQKLKFQDSYSLIPNKLSGFGKMFGIEQNKEFIPYGMYNKYNVDLRHLHITNIKQYTDKQVESNNIGETITNEMYNDFYKKFMENAKNWGCINSDNIDIIKYAEKYCEIDCEILEKGYNMFQDQILQVCKLNINNYVSVASIADAYLLSHGVYDDVYKLSGVVREFIQKCMVGGRTMCANNKKQYVKGKLDDFDAVNLYGSAMDRLGGYLVGKPKILNTTDYQVLKNYDGYFIEIKITKVGIQRSFSLMSEINKEGIRMFHNEMVGKILYVDKTTLEDLITFQNVEFEIIRGYYYDEGRNYKLKEVIQYLFNERLRQKELKNPIQNIYKLIMNSAYGKTLLKPIDEDTKYIYGEEKMRSILLANYTFIKEVNKIGNNNWEIKMIKSINTHYNNASCGIEVLSMSKRIMNEVMCLAEDNNYNIYYQDTDSMHIDSDNVLKLAKQYKSKYNRELIGKNMGQFHTDFDSDKLNGNIYAKESIFLGKKCYVDVLTDESEKVDYHIRMKGISSVSIKHHAKKDFKSVLELYQHLYNGKSYNFDLTCNALKPCFEMVSMNIVKTKTDFIRELTFP